MGKLLAVLGPGDLRANRVILLLELLRSLGYDLDIHVLKVKKRKKKLDQYWRNFKLSVHDLWFIFHLPLIGRTFFRVFGTYFMLTKELRECKAVFITTELNLASAVCAKVFFKKRVFYDVREMYLFGVNVNIPTWRRLLLDRWERVFLKHVDVITTVDSHRDVWIQRYRQINQNAIVLKNVPSRLGVNLEEIRNSVRGRHLDGVVHLAIVGAIKPSKGIKKVVEACKLVPRSVHLHLIGKVDSKFVSDLEKETITGNQGFQIFAREWMAYEDLVRYISQFHIGLLLKQPDVGQYGWIARGNSRKPFTYMHAGLPVLAPDHKSVVLHVEEEACGLRVDVRNPVAISEGIKKILRDCEQYYQMALNGISAIERKYNWEMESEKIVQVYKSYSGE